MIKNPPNYKITDGNKKHSRPFARRCLKAFLAGDKINQYTVNKSIEVLEIPSNLTFKEKLSYFQLIEMDKDEN